jgi:hypothetical protein
VNDTPEPEPPKNDLGLLFGAASIGLFVFLAFVAAVAFVALR